jgi:hypothetical protein
MTQPERYFNIDAIIYIPRTLQGEAARSLALAMTDAELKAWCDKVSVRDFDEPFSPEKYPWLDGSREGMIDFIVGSYLP